jgi:hypothetical protein
VQLAISRELVAVEAPRLEVGNSAESGGLETSGIIRGLVAHEDGVPTIESADLDAKVVMDVRIHWADELVRPALAGALRDGIQQRADDTGVIDEVRHDERCGARAFRHISNVEQSNAAHDAASLPRNEEPRRVTFPERVLHGIEQLAEKHSKARLPCRVIARELERQVDEHLSICPAPHIEFLYFTVLVSHRQ